MLNVQNIRYANLKRIDLEEHMRLCWEENKAECYLTFIRLIMAAYR